MEQFPLEPVESFELAELTDIEINAVAGGAGVVVPAAGTNFAIGAAVTGLSLTYGSLKVTADNLAISLAG